MRSRSTEFSYLRILLVLVFIIGILHFGKPLIVPLALAVLLTFVLTPIVTSIERLHFGRIPAVVVTVILAFGLIGAAGWGVGVEIQKPRCGKNECQLRENL